MYGNSQQHDLQKKVLTYSAYTPNNYNVYYSCPSDDKRSFSESTSEELVKIRTKMLDVSQAANVICRHTAFVSVDQETLEPLPSPIQV